MRLNLYGSFLSLLILSTFFVSCEKEFSLENSIARDTAVFNFTGSPQACINAVVSGNYQVGTVLDAGNTVSLAIDVTTPGTYTITTNTINGMAFSATGTFTTTGTQVLQLIGTGTPAAAGNFDYAPGSNGCTFTVVVSTVGDDAVFTYDGAPTGCTSAAAAGLYETGIPLDATNTVSIGVNVTVLGTYNINTPIVNGVSFAAAGSFTTTGLQTVVLVGTGTPTLGGVFNYTPSNNGCSFPITVTDPVTATDFIKCTIDGVERTFNIQAVGDQPDSTTLQLLGAETANSDSPFFAIELTQSPAITIGNFERPTLSNLDTFCIAAFSDGVAPTTWAIGLAGQAGGFKVIVTEKTPTRLSGTFEGTLYSDDGTGVSAKLVTAGEFSVPYQ